MDTFRINNFQSDVPSAANKAENVKKPGLSDPGRKVRNINKKSLRVLVVDDNSDSGMTLCWMLDAMGHETHNAQDSLQALVLGAKITPDILLLDLGLPGMNGYELCQKMKSLKGLERSLFIAQTGWGEREHHETSLQAGFDHHLVKPIHFETLEKILQQFLKSRN